MQNDRRLDCRSTLLSDLWADLKVGIVLLVTLSALGSALMTFGVPAQIVMPIVFTLGVGMPSVLYLRRRTTVITQRDVKTPSRRLGLDPIPWAFAITTLFLVTVGVMYCKWNGASNSYSCASDKINVVELSDGTVVRLSSHSCIRWSGSRKVTVEQGEAFFDVAHSAIHPIRVTAGAGEIRDLGTTFDVYRKTDDSVIVTVFSGKVVVKSLINSSNWRERTIDSNQQMEYASTGLIADVHTVVGSDMAPDWRIEPLASLVEELNHYSTKPIRISDARLEALNFVIGGAFTIHDVPAVLNRIRLALPITVTDNGDSYVLTCRARCRSIDTIPLAPEGENTQGISER